MERDPLWDGLKELGKKNHKERVAKTPERISYAISQFEQFEIDYKLKNEETGHFHCYKKSDGSLVQFYASTGKITGFENKRGIHALVKYLISEEDWK